MNEENLSFMKLKVEVGKGSGTKSLNLLHLWLKLVVDKKVGWGKRLLEKSFIQSTTWLNFMLPAWSLCFFILKFGFRISDKKKVLFYFYLKKHTRVGSGNASTWSRKFDKQSYLLPIPEYPARSGTCCPEIGHPYAWPFSITSRAFFKVWNLKFFCINT